MLEGRGATEVWQSDRPKLTFEWSEGSVFAFPRNTWHRMYNTSAIPVVFLAVTTAPQVMNAVDELDAIFSTEHDFMDLYQDNDQYFRMSDLRTLDGWYKQTIWHTNFIPDARNAGLNAMEHKVAGGDLTGYRMGKNFPHGHISQWPAGRYHKAHCHGPGAILLGLDGEGYVLAWPREIGPRPYQSGHLDQVVLIQWGKNSIHGPPNGWFHQHFNGGDSPARHIAVYGAKLPLGVHAMDDGAGNYLGYTPVDAGGTLINYEDEDPRVRQDFERLLGAKGIQLQMPNVVYR